MVTTSDVGEVSAETTTPKETVTFNEAQQAKVETIIREVQSRAARELRRENEQLRHKAEELTRKLEQASSARREPSEELENLHNELRNVQSEKQRYEQMLAERDEQITSTRKQNAIRDAIQGLEFIDPGDVIKLTQNDLNWDEQRQRFIVVNPDGSERMNAAYEPMSVQEFYQEFAAKKPQFVKGSFKAGSGSKPADGSTEPAVKLEDLFGAKSNGRLANQLALKNPAEYKRLRTLARQKGLIG